MKLNAYFLSAFAGAILPFAFAPFFYWPLAIFAPCLLLLTITTRQSKQIAFLPAKRRFFLAYLFGLSFFLVGSSWIFISIHTFGNTPAFFAALITFGFAAILACYPALLGLLTGYFHPKVIPISFACLGALLEWVRGWFLSGFPWLQLGQSQTLGPYKGYLPIIGVYGTSFLLFLSSGLLFHLCQKQTLRHPRFYLPATIVLGLLIVGAHLNSYHWTSSNGEKRSVALIQGNVPQEVKWTKEALLPTLNLYMAMTRKATSQSIIFWPEGAVPLPLPYAKNFLDHLIQFAKRNHTSVVLGIPIENHFQYYNAIISTDQIQNAYTKRHLVPFGEYVPLASLLRGIIGFLDLPMSNFENGDLNQALTQAAGSHFAPFICYEIAYTHLIFESLKADPDFLVTLSNDAWFGESWAPYQHAQIAQVAALLSGRYMVLNANSGLTAIYNEKGELLKSLPLFIQDTLEGEVFLMKGQTPWGKIGDRPILFSIMLVLIILALYHYKRKNA